MRLGPEGNDQFQQQCAFALRRDLRENLLELINENEQGLWRCSRRQRFGRQPKPALVRAQEIVVPIGHLPLVRIGLQRREGVSQVTHGAIPWPHFRGSPVRSGVREKSRFQGGYYAHFQQRRFAASRRTNTKWLEFKRDRISSFARLRP